MPELRWGLTLPFAGVPLAAHEPLVRRAEEAGYDDLWTGETNGSDGFTPLALAATWTERMRLGTGVVNPFTRGPAVLAQHAAALADASGGRFVLGIGSSSDVIVERWNERTFEKPLTRVRETVPVLREVLSGGRGPGGFKLETPPAEPVPIVIAALRDRMLRLGGELGDGTFVNFLPLSAAEHVAARVREGEAGREPTEIVCRFFCIPGEGLDVARFMFAAYGTVPVYEAFFRGLGWGEAIDPMVDAWRAGDRKLALEKVPEELIREIFILGDPDAMKERLHAFAERGITTFVLTPIGADLIDELAPVSEGLVDGRCWWGSSTPEYIAYHDEEWGRPVHDDRALFEKLCLEAFQSGLSWITILRKRENFRAAFAGFEIERVAAFGDDDVARLMADEGIVRNRAKIEAAIANARAAADLSLAELLWSFAPEPRPRPRMPADVPAVTAESTAMAKALKKRGFRFVGPTTAYALMQACGLVDDHIEGCLVPTASRGSASA